MPAPIEGLLHIPFGRWEETRATPRYHWNNANRGPDPFVIIQYTHRGEGIFELGGESHRVPPGHAFVALLPENSSYYYPENGGEPWVFSWINFYGDWSVPIWTDLRNKTGPVMALSPPTRRLMHRLITCARKRDWEDPYDASRAAYGFYLETLRHAPRPRAARPFQDVIAYFRSHYQKGIRMKEVAAFAGLSREHFTRRFTRQMGCAPATCLRGIRLEAAARLLRTTTLPIEETAFRTGWTSASKLDLFFKRRYGIAPREYRSRSQRRRSQA